ncbi:MAG: cupin domain-containing protein [Gammaproteobacteria bacterium]|nr:MAG: cupin domain-containing protein [Gammaproteobacteria bacterium]
MKLDLGVDQQTFLADFWQKQPCLIRGGLSGFTFDLDANDLAGLATAPQVESRLIWEMLDGQPWQPEHGPFDEEKLASLPESGWTLLVQGLDHWHRPLARLLDLFRFIPNWRLDDIMASVSPDGASVGPHFDYYDVFLIQAEGRKRWEIGPICDINTPRLDGTPLRILEDMQSQHSWTVEPGDILYLPSGYAHHGVAEGLSITLSVGFRSPTLQETASAWLDLLDLDNLPPLHVADGLKQPQTHPGWLDPRVCEQVRESLISELLTPARITRTLLRLSTEPKTSDIVVPAETPLSTDEVEQRLDQDWFWNEGSRFVYTQDGDELLLAADGTLFTLPLALQGVAAAVSDCSQPDFVPAIQELSPDHRELALSVLTQLVNQGSLVSERP